MDVAGYSTERSKARASTSAVEEAVWRPTLPASRRAAKAKKEQAGYDQGEAEVGSPTTVQEVEEEIGGLLEDVGLSLTESGEQGVDVEGDRINVLSPEVVCGGDDEGGDGNLRNLDACAEADQQNLEVEEETEG
jgi:hypothetical protein